MKFKTAVQSNSAISDNKWFPEINSVATARRAARQGMIASLFVAGVTTAFAIASTQNVLPSEMDEVFNPMLFVDALLYGAIAWGIQRMSRIAAIAGLTLYLLSRILLQASGVPTNLLGLALATLISVAFINAIRGTFAFHRFKCQELAEIVCANSEFAELK